MDALYAAVSGIHNLVGMLTLLSALVAGALLLARNSTTGGGAPLALRIALICASIQGTLGILLILLALASRGVGYVGTFWFHYLLGLVSVALVSSLAGRARRAPDSDARRFGLFFLVVVLIVAVTYYVGITRASLPIA